MKRIYLIATICLFYFEIHAQAQLGIRSSNYGGVNSLLLNPAASLTSPFRWDANLLEADQFFDNNYGFIENFRLLDLMENPNGIVLRQELNDDQKPTPTGSLVMDFYRSDQKKYGSATTQLLGPSLMLRLNEKITLGFFTRARVALDVQDVPPSLGYYEYNLQPFGESLLVEPFHGSVLSWSEIGLNAAIHNETDYGAVSFGASLKLLQGYEALYIRNNAGFDLTQLSDNRLQGTSLDFSYGFASAALENENWRLQRNGIGAGVDLGTVYTLGESENGSYRFRLGASLLDLGIIRFTRSAESHKIRTSDIEELALDDLHNFNGVENLDSILQNISNQLLNDPNASLRSRSFSMWTPAALSLQADANVLSSFFVNATLIQSIPIGKTAVRRNSIIALTPRFESRWFELAAPVSLLNWKQLRTGLSARVAFFWLGTEDLKSFLYKSNFDSTDFYIAIKLNPFSFNNKKEKELHSDWQGRGNARLRARGKNDIKCPKF